MSIARKIHFDYVRYGYADLDMNDRKTYEEFWDFWNEIRTARFKYYGHERLVLNYPILECWDDDIRVLKMKCLKCGWFKFLGVSVEERDWDETLCIINEYRANHNHK